MFHPGRMKLALLLNSGKLANDTTRAVWPQMSANSPLADQHDVGICPPLENGREHFPKSEEETGEDNHAANQHLQHLVPL